MRLAWLTAYVPWPASFGGSIRVFNVLRQAAREHTITLFALGDPATPVPQELRDVCSGGVYILPADHNRRQAQLRALITGRCSYQTMYASRVMTQKLAAHAPQLDAVVVDSTQMSWIPTPVGLPRILNLHNIEYELLERTATTTAEPLQRWFRRMDARRLRNAEIEAIRSITIAWTCSDRETALIKSIAPKVPVSTVANGVDPQRWTAGKSDQDIPDIVFVATMNYEPNADAARWFVEQVWPLLRAVHPALRLGLVGGSPSPRIQELAGNGISIHPKVPEVLPYYRGARLSIVPLRSGSGTRIKILEAGAVGTPQVSTPLGAEGLDVRHGEHLLLAESANDFAKACLNVLADPNCAKRRAQAARGLVMRHYTWDAAGDQLLASLKKLSGKIQVASS